MTIKDFTDSPRQWDHIAVIDRDAGIKGQFDALDPVLHMGYLYGLTEVPARSEAPAYIQILRFRPSIKKAFVRHRKRLYASLKYRFCTGLTQLRIQG